MSIMVWDYALDEPRLDRLEHHTEFSSGVDYNIFVQGLVRNSHKRTGQFNNLFLTVLLTKNRLLVVVGIAPLQFGGWEVILAM